MGGSADDIWGVQPMTGPTGLIFAMRSQYANTTNNQVGETFYNEVNTAFSSVVSGANTLGLKHTGTVPGSSSAGYANLAANGAYNFAGGMSTAQAEALGTTSNTASLRWASPSTRSL
nr:major capsid protein [Myoviridae environmental samples]